MEQRPAADPEPDGDLAKIGDLAAEAGIRRVHLLAWRDLDDVEAGGSEVHLDQVASRWAAAGLEVVQRSSFAAGHPPTVVRNGYRTIRRAGRYLVFPRAIAGELAGRHGRRDALVEVWNGMPFLTPVWARGPRLVLLHHVHRDMWRMALPASVAWMGDLLERRWAPPLYRTSQLATLSISARDDIHHEMGIPLDRIAVVPPGLSDRFASATPAPAADPTVLAVGRLVPVKRFDLLIRAAVAARREVPRLRLVIVGEGYEREALEAQIAQLGAQDWIELRGRVDDDGLLAAYREAWIVASTSLREGWGMSLSEAGAMGIPAVATRITGHVDVVDDGISGLLVDDADVAGALIRVLRDPELRNRMGQAAAERARRLSWTATATELMRLLAADALARHP
jgi:glycosyltransferase involved in cell wall biosynthesis